MMIKGIVSGIRFDQSLETATLTGSYYLTALSAAWQCLSASSSQQVYLPDATTLPKGWAVAICNQGSNSLDILNNNGTLIKTISAGSAFEFRCSGNDNASGTWIYFMLPSGSSEIAYRYIRLRATANNYHPTTPKNVSIFEIQFFETPDATGTPFSQGAPATAISFWDATYAASMACDGNAATRWNVASGETNFAWWYIDCGTSNFKILKSARILPFIATYSLLPQKIVFEGSNDATSWSQIGFEISTTSGPEWHYFLNLQ